MGFWVLALLGFVQGICEFLPISSSGHLVLLSKLFGIEDSLFVSIILHIATLFAVLIVFRKDLWRMIRNPLSKEVVTLALSTICTCMVAIVVMPYLKQSFGGELLPLTFALSGVILFLVEMCFKGQKGARIGIKNAFIIGLAQGAALLPGLSRSGTTIAAGIASGADKKECAKFSFLLSIPTILGSLVLECYDFFSGGCQISINVAGLVVGVIVAFLVGLVSIKCMLKITEKASFKYFALYLAAMSILSWIVL